MDRTSALRILGLREDASPEEIQAARATYWALRAHVEERASQAESEALRRARRDELAALEGVLRALDDPAARGSRARGARLRTPWLAAWALAVTAAALVLVVAFVRGGEARAPRVAVEGDGAGGAAGSDGDGDPPSAWLAARANRDGAQLEIRPSGEDLLLASGPADGTPLRIDPGRYDLRVHHPECPDTWSREVGLEQGQRVELAPRVCADTGFLVVRSNVADDRLSIDGQALGSTGPERHALSVGEHAVRVEKPGFQPWDGAVEVPPAEDVTLRAELRSERDPARGAGAPPVAAAQPRPVRDAGDASDDRSRMSAWHETVTKWLLARYDQDLSGHLDTPSEVESIPCSEWQGLEQSYNESGLAVPLTRLYGFDGSAWKEGALGFDVRMRGYAYERMKKCGLR